MIETVTEILQAERGIHPKAMYLDRWLKEFMDRNRLKYDPEYNTFTSPNALFPIKRKDSLTLLYTMAIKYGFPTNCRRLLEDMWSQICAVEHQRYLESIKDDILTPSPTPEAKNLANDLLARLVWVMTGRNNHLDVTSLKQFIWSVKQNLAGKSEKVSHIMMPVIYGKQDTGKTHIILNLLSPLGELSIKSDFTIFQKEENLQAFEQMFVVFLDEMGKAKETSIESIKKIMSKGNHLQRQYFTQDQFAKIKSKATFIAATNRPLGDIIIDDEMRRFWQIEMMDYGWVSQHWDKYIKTMDWRALWNCVDVDDREPADVIWPLFKKTQSVYARGNHLQDFITERIVLDTDEWQEAIQLYRDYQIWCEYNHISKPLTRHVFSTKIKEFVTHKHSNGTKYNYSIKPFEDPKPYVNKYDLENSYDEGED